MIGGIVYFGLMLMMKGIVIDEITILKNLIERLKGPLSGK
jgi:hypothetical protein